MVKSWRYKIIFLFVLSIAFGVFFKGHAEAAATIAIEPTRIELALSPGQTANNKLRVSNRGDKPITVELSTEAFSVTNEQYDIRFSEAEEIGKWIRLSQKQVEIPANKTASINYELAVPNTAEAGGRYLTIFAKTIKAEDGSNLFARLGQMLYLTVSGNVKKDGKLVDYSIPKIVFNRNVEWTYRVKNSGSVHFYSPIESTVVSLFRQKTAIEKTDHLIMPNTVRLIRATKVLPAWPGIYTIKANIGLPQFNADILGRILFVPLPFLFILLLIILVLTRTIKNKYQNSKMDSKK